jgi:tRNA(Arg) A34 adenosine deaminase TadA
MSSQEALATALLSTTEHSIIPLTAAQVSRGSKLFGAAILSRNDNSLVIAETNNEAVSPLLHGEINCIQEFFKLPKEGRPETKECVFFATHEPCSLCLSGITWSGFNEFYYMFTYEDSRDLFAIPCKFIIRFKASCGRKGEADLIPVDDIDILKSVYQVPGPNDTDESLEARPLYNRKNKFFTAQSLADLIESVGDKSTRMKLKDELTRVKAMYDKLSATYQEGKKTGAASSSFFK